LRGGGEGRLKKKCGAAKKARTQKSWYAHDVTCLYVTVDGGIFVRPFIHNASIQVFRQ
jgi:hypothetical protein